MMNTEPSSVEIPSITAPSTPPAPTKGIVGALQHFVAHAIVLAIAGMLGAAAVILVSPARSVVWEKVSLGPADEVILSGTPDPLTVTSQSARLAWSADATARAYSAGVMHLDRVMRALLQSERFEASRIKLKEEADSQNAEFEQRFKEFQEKYGASDPKSPNFPEGKQEYEQLRREYEQWMKGIQSIQAKLAVEQIEAAYREILLAVEVVSEHRKIDSVLRFIPASKDFDSGSVADAMLQIHARTFLRVPEGIDITEEVMKEMALIDPPDSPR
ncbi:MAG: hypothetical protein EXS00_01075 [Phycisphaerales bacterium]|nr:hypothetical protein [Phycisphaerales bacterium]